MTSARSSGLGRPAKVILVPGMSFFGLARKWKMLLGRPVAAVRRHRVGVGEALDRADRPADHAVQVRADRVAAVESCGRRRTS